MIDIAALLASPAAWSSLLTLTVMEIVLGVDNVIFIAILVNGLPEHQRATARRVGLGLALVLRVAMLLGITWIAGLTQPVFTALGHGFTWKDLILVAGGFFLLYKATHEIHGALEGEPHEGEPKPARGGMASAIAQIILLDIIFSLDSVITAVGMAEQVEIMIAAVMIAVGVMALAAGPIAAFVARHPTVKNLALSFLFLIGATLIADGAGHHVPKGYIYAAMGFSVAVEILNLVLRSKSRKHAG